MKLFQDFSNVLNTSVSRHSSSLLLSVKTNIEIPLTYTCYLLGSLGLFTGWGYLSPEPRLTVSVFYLLFRHSFNQPKTLFLTFAPIISKIQDRYTGILFHRRWSTICHSTESYKRTRPFALLLPRWWKLWKHLLSWNFETSIPGLHIQVTSFTWHILRNFLMR